MWGIIPAAGSGTRIQPLGFAKELLPLGSRIDGHVERPRAASEYLVERMLLAGATRICFVISPSKPEIIRYYGDRVGGADTCYVDVGTFNGYREAMALLQCMAAVFEAEIAR